jgi:hypothetical protein
MYFTIAFLICFILGVLWISVRPKNDRTWSGDQKVLPYAEVNGDYASVFNIRNFVYTAKDVYTERFYDRTYNLADLTHLYYMVVPFSRTPGIAHACVSFGFANGDHLAISVEARKKVGLSYSLPRAFIKGYELMYVIADEQDIIKLRTDHKGENVFMYTLDLPQEVVRKTFVDMLERANKLIAKPEFYHPITNTCTNNVIRHINNALSKDRRIPFHISVILPRWSDAFFYKLGLIKNDHPFEEIKRRAHVNKRSKALQNDDPEFSQKIRV